MPVSTRGDFLTRGISEDNIYIVKKEREAEKMKRKVIFFDVDGTIMDERGYVPASAIEAIRAAGKNGVACIVNTGRPYTHIEPFIVDIGFDGYICSCGQYLFLDGKEIFRAPMDPEICGAIAVSYTHLTLPTKSLV